MLWEIQKSKEQALFCWNEEEMLCLRMLAILMSDADSYVVNHINKDIPNSIMEGIE